VELEGLGQLKKLMTSSGSNPRSSSYQLRYRVPPKKYKVYRYYLCPIVSNFLCELPKTGLKSQSQKKKSELGNVYGEK
jgi:hypothetical protein